MNHQRFGWAGDCNEGGQGYSGSRNPPYVEEAPRLGGRGCCLHDANSPHSPSSKQVSVHSVHEPGMVPMCTCLLSCPCPICVSLAWSPLCSAGNLFLTHLFGSFVLRGQSCTVWGSKSENNGLGYLFNFQLKGKHSIVTWSEPEVARMPHWLSRCSHTVRRRKVLAWPLPAAKSTRKTE